MIALGLVLQTLATVAFGTFVPFPSDLTTTKGYAGFNVRWKEVPTGICELVRALVRTSVWGLQKPGSSCQILCRLRRCRGGQTHPLCVFRGQKS